MEYSVAPAGEIGIWSIDVERGSLSLLVGREGRRTAPVWRSGEEGFLFIESIGRKSAIVSRGSEGSQAMTLVEDEALAASDAPALSPDGKALVYAVEREAQFDLKLATLGELPRVRDWLKPKQFVSRP